MASGANFPTTIDVFNNKVDGVDDILAVETNTQSSALEELEALVGVTGSSVVTSHEYKINNVILSDPTTTRGDILVRDASVLSRLALGSAGSIAYSDGTDLGYFPIGTSGQTLKSTGTELIWELDSTELDPFRIISGVSQTDGFPDFFNFATTTATLDTSTPFIYMANYTEKTLSDDVVFAGLTTAAAATNTCVSDDATYADDTFTKTEGEFGSTFMTVDAMGVSVIAKTGTYQPFKHGAGPEFFYANILSTTVLDNCTRGIAGSDREVMSEDDTITILIANHLFLNIDGSTQYTTTNYPTFSSTAPSSPDTGDWYFNTGTSLWYRYSGAAFVAINANWLASAICDDTGIVGIEYQDFYKVWKDDNNVEIEYVSAVTVRVKINRLDVAGNTIETDGIGHLLDLSAAGDRETGVSEANSTLYFIYIDNVGKARYSDVCPRMADYRQAMYHPLKYWRCVGTVYNDSGGDITPFIFRDGEYTYTPNGSGAADIQLTSALFPLTKYTMTSSYVLYDFSEMPPYCSIGIFKYYTSEGDVYVRTRINSYSVAFGADNALAFVGYRVRIGEIQNSTCILKSTSAGQIGAIGYQSAL